MTTNASALPALLPGDTDTRKLNQYVNTLIRFYNRPDLFVPSYAPDTGSGTAYVTTPSADIKFYEVGQEFDFKAANANTSTAPTLNVQGLGAGTITKLGGQALALGDIAANSFNKVIVSSTTPTFELISPAASTITNVGATTFLGVDVPLGAAGFVNGPNTGSIGAAGWVVLVIATGNLLNTDSVGHNHEIGIFNGSAYIANSAVFNGANSTSVQIAVSAVVTLSGATTFTLRAHDIGASSTGTLKTTGVATGASNVATSITYVRIA